MTSGYWKIKKDGTRFKNMTKCDHCDGTGFQYKELPEKAGLQVTPTVALASAGGFKTDKNTLVELEKTQRNPEVKKFLNSLIRLSAIDTYVVRLLRVLKGIREVTPYFTLTLINV